MDNELASYDANSLLLPKLIPYDDMLHQSIFVWHAALNYCCREIYATSVYCCWGSCKKQNTHPDVTLQWSSSRLDCRYSPKNIFNAKNFNRQKKPISLLNVPICTQGRQRTWWPEAGTIIVTGPYFTPRIPWKHSVAGIGIYQEKYANSVVAHTLAPRIATEPICSHGTD